MITIKKLPNYKGGDLTSCFNIHSAFDWKYTLPSAFGAVSMCIPRCLVPTGLEFTITGPYGVEITGRSGLASKHGIVLLNPPTLSSANYGELKVVICNLGGHEFTIHPGDIVGEAKIVKLVETSEIKIS